MTPELERRLATIIAWSAVLMILVALLPTRFGGVFTYSVVVGDSMQPLMKPGDLAIAAADDTYAVGDIVVFRVPEGQLGEGGYVIHRIIEFTDDGGIVTQGDNKDRPDFWELGQQDILGRRLVAVPQVGGLIATGGLLLLLLALVAGVLAFQAVMRWEGSTDRQLEPAPRLRGA